MNTTNCTSRRINTKGVLAAVVIAASALMPAAVEAGPVEDVEQSCLAHATGSADSHERWVDHCRGRAGEHEDAYHPCMLDAPGSPDSLERWVDHCHAEAVEIAGTG